VGRRFSEILLYTSIVADTTLVLMDLMPPGKPGSDGGCGSSSRRRRRRKRRRGKREVM